MHCFHPLSFARSAASVLAVALLWFAPAAWSQQAPPAQVARLRFVADETLPTPLLAPDPSMGGLSLPELEQMAIANNPSIARAASLLEAARGNWTQVGLPLNPSVGYEGQQLGSGGQAEQHGVAISQEIVRGGKLRLNRAVAAQEVIRAESEFAAQQQRVITDARIAFYQALLAQRQIDVTIELVRIGQQGLDATDAVFRAKEGSRVDVLQAQLELENAEILAENARNRHLAAWQSLAAVVGVANLTPQPLAGDAYAPPRAIDFGDTIRRLQSASPEVGMALATIERSRFALDRARAEPRPNVNVQGLMNWTDNGIGGKPDAGIAVTVPLPLWNKNQGAILKADNELAAARQALAQLQLELQHRLAPVYERYANARNQVDRYRTRILPAARQSLDLTRKAYSTGELSFINLLTVQRTFSQTNLSYLDA